jgi:hypothetical protein
MIDRATGRAVAVVVLLILVAASLRGYLPGGQPGPRHTSQDSPAAVIFLAVLLGVTLAIVAVAVITQSGAPRPPAVSAGGVPRRVGGPGRPRWQVVLFGAGLLAAMVLLGWLLARLVAPHGIGQSPSGTAPSTPPPAPDTPEPPEPSEAPDVGGAGGAGAGVLGYLGAAAAIFTLLLVAGGVIGARRRRRSTARPVVVGPPEAATPAQAAESLVHAAEAGLAEVGDLRREPREAIIACYAAMEGELANIPGAAPQDFDTPTEVLARAVQRRVLRADNAAQLVSLFTEARFSSHLMNEEHRETAVAVLQLVLTELRSVV